MCRRTDEFGCSVASTKKHIIYWVIVKLKLEISVSWVWKDKHFQPVSHAAVLGCRCPMIPTSALHRWTFGSWCFGINPEHSICVTVGWHDFGQSVPALRRIFRFDIVFGLDFYHGKVLAIFSVCFFTNLFSLSPSQTTLAHRPPTVLAPCLLVLQQRQMFLMTEASHD